MNWPTLVAATIVASAAIAALVQEPKSAPAAPPKAVLAHTDAFVYDGSSITSFAVKDMKAAKAWYGKVLGANVFYELAEQGWCELTTSVPNTMIGLSSSPDAKGGGGDATMSFGVKDMAKAKAWLVKNEVKLEGEVVEIPKTVKLLYFRDPDGNRLMFYEAYVGS